VRNRDSWFRSLAELACRRSERTEAEEPDEGEKAAARRWLDEVLVMPQIAVTKRPVPPRPLCVLVWCRQQREIARALFGPPVLPIEEASSDWRATRVPTRWIVGLAHLMAVPEAPFDRFLLRWEHRRRELVSAAHAEYAEALERCAGSDLPTSEAPDLFDQLQGSGNVYSPGWPDRLKWWLTANGPSRMGRRLEAFVQRGERGWADADLIQLNAYLEGVIGDSLRHSIGASPYYGGPMREPWPTPGDLEEELRSLADLFAGVGVEGPLGQGRHGASAADRERVMDQAFHRLAKVWPWLFY
jgi:hypothetical protein